MCYPFSWFKVIFLSFRAESFLFCHEVFINLCQKYNDIKRGRLIPDSIKIKAIRLDLSHSAISENGSKMRI
jgi:hypothetical protein